MFEAQLRAVPFFNELSKGELAMVAQLTDEVEVEPGSVLAREGDVGHEFFMIIDGTAAVLRGDDVLAELGPGEFFGEMALIEEDRRMATVKAISAMKVLQMTRASFRGMDRSMPGIHAAVTEAIEKRRAAADAQPAPAV